MYSRVPVAQMADLTTGEAKAIAKASATKFTPPFHGEGVCVTDGCKKKAYYLVGKRALCGVHSKDFKRKGLPKRPADEKKAIDDAAMAEHKKACDAVAAKNKEEKKRGQVICYRMGMMQKPPLRPGFLNVLPNNRAHAGQNGTPMPALSPMRLGPVVHGQPGLPVAQNIENLHQGNKVFPCFLNNKAAFYVVRRAMYESKEPFRHQNDFWAKHPELVRDVMLPKEKTNTPAYSTWVMPDGAERKFTYVESRQFYCHFYEQLAAATTEYKWLNEMLDVGYNICLCGYDGHPMHDSYRMHYLDPAVPFGHERVLATMLSLPPEQYPWRLLRSKGVVLP